MKVNRPFWQNPFLIAWLIMLVLLLAWFGYRSSWWPPFAASDTNRFPLFSKEEIEPGKVETPVPVGFSRSNPHPPGSTVSLAHWQVTVLQEPIRGLQAWEMVQAANQFNDPPAENQEYLLLLVQVSHTRTTEEEKSISLHLTGAANVVHYSFYNSQVPPAPPLNTFLAGQAQSTGWEVFTIYQGEGNLLLLIEDLANYDEPPQYLALTADPPPTVPAALLRDIQRTEVGASPESPAVLGDIATSAGWQMQVMEIIRGNAAWERLLATNRFNDPPEPGYEYLLVHCRVAYLGLAEGPHYLSQYSHFAALSANGQEYERPSLVLPDPEMFGKLFPGGEISGWLAFAVRVDDPAPLLRFAPSPAGNDTADDVRYFLLVADGR